MVWCWLHYTFNSGEYHRLIIDCTERHDEVIHFSPESRWKHSDVSINVGQPHQIRNFRHQNEQQRYFKLFHSHQLTSWKRADEINPDAQVFFRGRRCYLGCSRSRRTKILVADSFYQLLIISGIKISCELTNPTLRKNIGADPLFYFFHVFPFLVGGIEITGQYRRLLVHSGDHSSSHTCAGRKAINDQHDAVVGEAHEQSIKKKTRPQSNGDPVTGPFISLHQKPDIWFWNWPRNRVNPPTDYIVIASEVIGSIITSQATSFEHTHACMHMCDTI